MNVRQRLKKIIDEAGLAETIKLFKLGENSILRYLGDVQYSRGTASVIENDIDKVEEAIAKAAKAKKA